MKRSKNSNIIKEIVFMLENMEMVTIPKSRIAHLILNNIQNSIITDVDTNSAITIKTINDFAIEILNEDCENKYIKRLLDYNDITQVWIVYKDKTQEQYFVEYNEPEGQEYILGAENVNQKSYMSKFGNVYIKISKDCKMEEWIDFEEVDNEDYMTFFDNKEIYKNEISGVLFN